MGSNGASSGIARNGMRYGTEFSTVYQSDEIKFVRANRNMATAPMETMTDGRVYVSVNRSDRIKSIVFFDENHRRYKTIDVDHTHFVNGRAERPHTHYGYFHDENGSAALSAEEAAIVDRVRRMWHNWKGR